MSHSYEPERTGEQADRRLYVELLVQPDPDQDCPLVDLDGDVAEFRQQSVGDECHADAMRTADGAGPGTGAETEVVHTTTAIGSRCLCTVFAEFDCVPRVTEVVDGGAVHVETYLPDRELLPDLVDVLEGVTEQVSFRRLRRVDEMDSGERSETATIELYELTDKQREAAVKAVAEGYYETPRGTSFEAMADDIGITKSALSQRLSAVEAKLATAAFEGAVADD